MVDLVNAVLVFPHHGGLAGVKSLTMCLVLSTLNSTGAVVYTEEDDVRRSWRFHASNAGVSLKLKLVLVCLSKHWIRLCLTVLGGMPSCL